MPIKDLREELNKTHRPIIISDDKDGNTNGFKCKYCHRIIRGKFTEDSIWCNSCQSETIFDKDTKLVKKSLKAETIDNTEVNVVSLQYNFEDMAGHTRYGKPIEYKGGIKVLRDKGLKITNYKEGVG